MNKEMKIKKNVYYKQYLSEIKNQKANTTYSRKNC